MENITLLHKNRMQVKPFNSISSENDVRLIFPISPSTTSTTSSSLVIPVVTVSSSVPSIVSTMTLSNSSPILMSSLATPVVPVSVPSPVRQNLSEPTSPQRSNSSLRGSLANFATPANANMNDDRPCS